MIKFATFRVWVPLPKRLNKYYYKVYIFARESSMYYMRDELEKVGANHMRKPHKYLACCSSFKHKKDKHQLGVVMFTLNSAARSGTVSHEMTHATTYFWKMVRPNLGNIFNNHKADEMFAMIQGELVRQFWIAWYKNIKKK